MAVKVGINGFGRIGRNIMRAALGSKDIDFVAVNDLTNAATLAHLLKYDSVLGNLDADVKATADGITVDGDEFKVLSVKDPAQLPWKDLGVRRRVRVHRHLHHPRRRREAPRRRARRRSSSPRRPRAPTSRSCSASTTTSTTPAKHHIISNASCTTNCLAPLAKVIHERFGIRKGWMTTIHSYTNDQNLLDLPHKDLRRARAAALSMIPTTHRRGVGRRRGAAGAEGKARRLRHARADAERLGRRPERRARQEDDRRGGERRAARGGGRAAQRASSPCRTRSSCRSTSEATRTRPSSTRRTRR